ncbi:MAG: nitroreductase [bacterium]|nr:nitroreductase [bacterium]
MDIKQIRQPVYPIDDRFINRWSPRAFSGEPIRDDELMTLFEAARWAPSSFNAQPWFFLYAKRDTPQWNTFFDLLIEFNQQWCKNAAVLLVAISRKNFEHNGKPNANHSFDTGSAWQSLALQTVFMGLAAHGMAGFDAEKARVSLNIPDEFHVDAMIAIGKPGDKNDLPEAMREREAPSQRKPIGEFIKEGGF